MPPGMPFSGAAPASRMAGLRVGVTAGRRGAELVEALTRLGARVLWAPTVEVVAAPAGALARETSAVLGAGPAWVVVTTAEGLDRWVEGAGTATLMVLELLLGAKVAARGAKATASSSPPHRARNKSPAGAHRAWAVSDGPGTAHR